MLPEQRATMLHSSFPLNEPQDISSLFNSPKAKTTNLFNSPKYKYLMLYDIPIYITDKGLQYVEAMRMVQCVLYFWPGVIKMAYNYGADAFKEIGVTTTPSALQKAAPFDYGDMRRGELYVAFGANESSVLGKEATILVKCYNFSRIYDAFSVSAILSKFKL